MNAIFDRPLKPEVGTLPETNIAPENWPSQKETWGPSAKADSYWKSSFLGSPSCTY